MTSQPHLLTMEELLSKLKSNKVIKTDKVYKAMQSVDRSDFIQNDPFDDCPQRIGFNTTISAPHMHAFALEYLAPVLKENDRVMDVGSGTGYLTLALSKVMNDKGLVVGVEHIKEFCDLSKYNIMKKNANLLDNGKIIIECGDGRLGYEKYAPYKCIHVGAAAEEIPKSLINQLDNGGRMFIPVGKLNSEQVILLVDKDKKGKVTETELMSVRYGSLTSVEEQKNRFK